MNIFSSLLICFFFPLAHTRPLISKPDYELYHTKEELLAAVHEIVDRNPRFMRMTEIYKMDEDYSVTIPVVSVEPGGFTSHTFDKIRIMISFGEHGREIITTELGLKLLQSLETIGLPKNEAKWSQYPKLQEILNQTVWKIIPMENPNGRQLFEEGKLCERKNGRGVDINRNWDVDFGQKEKDYDASEEYPGAYAFSEPETGILRDLSQAFQQHVWIGVHSGMCAVFMPFDYKGKIPNGPSAKAQLQILQIINDTILTENCKYGPGGKTVGYLAHGTATDFMYSKLKVPLSFTWEIYGDEAAGFHDCYKSFNPTEKELLDKTLEEWIAAIFLLVTLLPTHPDIQKKVPVMAAFNETKNSTSEEMKATSRAKDQGTTTEGLSDYEKLMEASDQQIPGLRIVGLSILILATGFVFYIAILKRKKQRLYSKNTRKSQRDI